MGQNLQLVARLLEEVKVLGVGDNRLAKVDGAVDHGLLLLALKDAWKKFLSTYIIFFKLYFISEMFLLLRKHIIEVCKYAIEFFQ